MVVRWLCGGVRRLLYYQIVVRGNELLGIVAHNLCLDLSSTVTLSPYSTWFYRTSVTHQSHKKPIMEFQVSRTWCLPKIISNSRKVTWCSTCIAFLQHQSFCRIYKLHSKMFPVNLRIQCWFTLAEMAHCFTHIVQYTHRSSTWVAEVEA